VEPEHRVVARSLERDWNEKLTVLDQRERDSTAMAPAAARQVSEAERQGILDVVHDLPAVWQADTTTHAERTQVVRLLIKDVTLTTLATTIRIAVRWHTHACRTLAVPRPPRAAVLRRPEPAVVERVRQLAQDHTDIAIAARLHPAGDRSGQGGPFSASTVAWLRST
jgi:hypothetical protein